MNVVDELEKNISKKEFEKWNKGFYCEKCHWEKAADCSIRLEYCLKKIEKARTALNGESEEK